MDCNELVVLAERFPDANLAEIAALLMGNVTSDPGPWKLGQAYHIRTVTNYWIGRLVSVSNHELVLEDATWVADTGRFADFFRDGPNECEPVDGPVIVGRGSIVDAQLWEIKIPRAQR
jgi:hypothetical protein